MTATQYVRCSKAFTDRDPGHIQGVFISVSVCTCRDESLAAWLFRLQSPVQYHVRQLLINFIASL